MILEKKGAVAIKIGKENEKLEFKKTTAELKEGVISMVAMLNKHGSGEIYFGVNNNGTVLGQMVSDKTLRDISRAVSNHIEPKIYPKIELVYLDDKQCILVEFAGDEAPYFAYGRAYIRVADEDKVMSPTELGAFFTRKSAGRGSWDGELSDKSPNNADEAVLKDYLERANQAGRVDFTYASREDMLARLDLVKDGKLVNAAAVLFIGAPLLEIQMATFATTERLTFNDIKRDTGRVPHMVEVAERYIRNTIRWRVVLDGSIKRKEIPEIPMDAVREALVNSFCHRDYKSSQNNIVAIFSNRVEIYNPGSFPEGLTPQDFITGSEYSVKRNPLLAQLMYFVKDIESFGTGLKRITDACDAVGVTVEFQMQKMGFSVIFYRPEFFSDADIGENGDSIGDSIGENDDGIGENGDSIGENGDSIGENDELNDVQGQIIAKMCENPKVSAKAIALDIGIAPRNVEVNIKALKQIGLVERVGPAKGGHWAVKR